MMSLLGNSKEKAIFVEEIATRKESWKNEN
jgi:hypothetical protein